MEPASVGLCRAEEIMQIPRLASVAVAGILTLSSPLPSSPLLPVTTAMAPAGGLVSAEHIITALYAYPGISLWNLVTDHAPVPYYQALYNFVHALGGIVMLDSGTVTASSYCYLPASDILGVFAGPQSGFQAMSFPSWLARYPSSRFAAVISAGTSPGIGTDAADAARDGIGNVYIDDEAEPPGYAKLPAFWPAEIADMTGATAPPG